MSTASTSASPPRRRSTLLSRRHGDTTDPSILAARERIMGAEEAERQADRALDIARREVRDARDQILASRGRPRSRPGWQRSRSRARARCRSAERRWVVMGFEGHMVCAIACRLLLRVHHGSLLVSLLVA
ncbi:hypothetical protein MCOR02_000854 [Pyricularia oryzae]|nr:hypothetical protein MCOR02_000854 [Pyricularia oryzae]